MQLKRLTLRNFRNFPQIDLRFGFSPTIFIGNNAQGKSNLLEAIYFLVSGRSPRTTKDNEMVRWDCEATYLRGEIERAGSDILLEIIQPRVGKRTIKFNNNKLNRLTELIGQIKVSIFSAEDLGVVKADPSYRRRFIDLSLFQLSPQYLFYSQRYQKILQQRNMLLKRVRDKEASPDQLEVWDKQLIDVGAELMLRRINYISRLDDVSSGIHRLLTEGVEKLEIVYEPSFPINIGRVEGGLPSPIEGDGLERIKDSYRQKIRQRRGIEIHRGMTLYGPHRDDLIFYVNDVDMKVYGSQGQQRTIALSLKLAELEIIGEEAEEAPLLLLDDVASELDDPRREFVFTQLEKEKVQIFITGNRLDDFPFRFRDKAEIFMISGGWVESIVDKISINNHRDLTLFGDNVQEIRD